MGFPIRIPAARWMCAPPRGFSQLSASFFGPWRLGIRPLLFLSCCFPYLSLPYNVYAFTRKSLPSPEAFAPGAFRLQASTLSSRILFSTRVLLPVYSLSPYPDAYLKARCQMPETRDQKNRLLFTPQFRLPFQITARAALRNVEC